MQLLNWKVWCQRYHISLEFLLTFILRNYRFQRKASPPAFITLGIPVATITGVTCRKRLEEELIRLYPNGENYRAVRSRQPPPLEIPWDDPDQVAEAYNEEMLRWHRKALYTVKRRRSPRQT